MKEVKVGQQVVVYDRFRLAVPVRGIVHSKSTINDGIEVQLRESNNARHPIGCTIWVSRRQLRKDK